MKEVRLDQESTRPKIGFIGAGMVGTALAIRLSGKGYPVVAVSSRTMTSAERLAEAIPGCRAYDSVQTVADSAQLVFITTPDDAIAEVAGAILWNTGQGVVHCSGADSTDILEPARKYGALVGAFHPLQTFASTAHAIENIPGSTFAVEAEEPLLTTFQGMAIALEGTFIRLNAGDKVLYHTAAVVACNYLVTLVKLATDLWQSFGVSSQQATRSLLPLLRGTLNNIDNVGIPDCLTGPIARGDSGTIKKHISALERSAPGILSTYRELGLQTIPIALAKGKIDDGKGNELQTLLKEVNS
ncbi:MAG: DUF2520 domain-containing protein [Dehalococcoidia bacterium]|nr:DUF2520 domain-containing protein [Dehalococcoidia bacterium]